MCRWTSAICQGMQEQFLRPDSPYIAVYIFSETHKAEGFASIKFLGPFFNVNKKILIWILVVHVLWYVNIDTAQCIDDLLKSHEVHSYIAVYVYFQKLLKCLYNKFRSAIGMGMACFFKIIDLGYKDTGILGTDRIPTFLASGSALTIIITSERVPVLEFFRSLPSTPPSIPVQVCSSWNRPHR